MNLFQQLDAEWLRVGKSRDARQRLAEWSLTSTELRRFEDLDALVRYANRRGDPHESDRVLVVLARRAPEDELAARTLLQALMPGIRWLARRYEALAAAAMEDSASAVVAFAYERIRTYPFERRPQRVAANVLLDTRQRLHRTIGRPRPHVISLESLLFEPTEGEPSCDNLCTLLDDAVAREVIGGRDAALIALTRLHEHPVADLAAQLGCTAQTLRRRRRRAETRLLAIL